MNFAILFAVKLYLKVFKVLPTGRLWQFLIPTKIIQKNYENKIVAPK